MLMKTDLSEWLYDPSDPAWGVVVSVLAIFLILGICTRFGKLRSLSQMTGFDFGVNVAIGSILASCVVAPDPSVYRAGLALVTIFVMQVAYSWLRRHLPILSNPSSQKPHVLYANGSFVEPHLRATNFTRSDIHQAIRTAKARTFDDVDFILAEPTGTITVFTKGGDPVSGDIYREVVGVELLPTT